MPEPKHVRKPTSIDDDLPEVKMQSFIVKIWVEDTGDSTGTIPWRGSITHVVSGDRRYVKNLEEITRFFKTYLQGIGIESVTER
jgi:hypothetical protein